MMEGIYGFLGVLIGMVGVAVGILVNLSKKIDRLERLLEREHPADR